MGETVMRFDVDTVRQQIANLLVMHPELAEDDVLRADMVEGSTDAHEFLSSLTRKIGEDEAAAAGLEEYRHDLLVRKARLEHRAEVLRALAFKVMQAADLKKVELPEATLSVRNGTPKVIITDEA